MIEHPDYARWCRLIRRLSPMASSFKGPLYRACTPVYANQRDLLTGAGAHKYGGRWNAPGRFPLVYLSQTVEGAIAETLGLSGRYGFDPAAHLPLTLVAIDATLANVLDLTNVHVRQAFRVTIKAMTDCPWKRENDHGREAFTQALARVASDAGLEGIIVPSAVQRTIRNLNVFPANLAKKSKLEICRADKLPPPGPAGVV